MRVDKTEKIKDLLIFYPEIFYDFRGENVETFNHYYTDTIKQKININLNFIVDSFSISRKNVLRGMHGDKFTWKLVQCLSGEVYSVVLDLRKNSPTYKNYFNIILNDKNKLQVLIPVGCLNGYLCLSDRCIYFYKLSHQYIKQEDQITKKWNDPEYNIYWPITNPITSQRDA